MWIEETKNGKFKFVERYTDYITGKQKKVSVTLDKNTPKNRKLALDMLNKKMQLKLPTEQDKITLKYLSEKYFEYQKRTVKLSTYNRNKYSIDKTIEVLGEDTLVDKLSASYITSSLLATDKKPTTINEDIKRFKAMLNWGYLNDYVQDISYLQKVKKLKDTPHKIKIQDKYLEPEEIKKVLNHMSKNNCWHWYYFAKFLILSGLRSGEAIALKNDDIDFDNRIIKITKTYDYNNKIYTTPKTISSNREVYMQDELLELSKKIIEFSNEQKLFNGKSNDVFLVGLNGGIIDLNAFNKYLRENTEKAIGRKFSAHALRHTHASLLLAEGINIDAISRRLGHENSTITKEIYLHITEKLKEKENEAIKNIKLT